MSKNRLPSEEFLQETMELSRFTKPMKVNALRLAYAKRRGFSTVEAYMAHLDQSEATPKGSSKASATVDLDPNTWIRLNGSRLTFQAESILTPRDISTDTSRWEEDAALYLTGDSDRLTKIHEVEIDGVTYVSGQINLYDNRGNLTQAVVKAMEHFCREQEDVNWSSAGIMSGILRRLMRGGLVFSLDGRSNDQAEESAATTSHYKMFFEVLDLCVTNAWNEYNGTLDLDIDPEDLDKPNLDFAMLRAGDLPKSENALIHALHDKFDSPIVPHPVNLHLHPGIFERGSPEPKRADMKVVRLENPTYMAVFAAVEGYYRELGCPETDKRLVELLTDLTASGNREDKTVFLGS